MPSPDQREDLLTGKRTGTNKSVDGYTRYRYTDSVMTTRPPEKMQFVGLRLEPSLKADIERAASKAGVGFAEWIRAVVRMELKRLPKSKP